MEVVSNAGLGRWAEENVGITTRTVASQTGERLEDLVGIGLRRNPKRAQLLVSRVLGKHIPTDPQEIHSAGTRLGELVEGVLVGRSALVVGFAETATLLGHLVADAIEAPYIHSTRRLDDDSSNWSTFTEAHSHAPAHALQPWPPSLMTHGEVVVLVDDELSTASTAIGTIQALHEAVPRSRYVIAALVDMRTDADRTRVATVARALGVEIDCVSLVCGEITIPEGLVPPPDKRSGPTRSSVKGELVRLTVQWPKGVREGGRHGFTSDHREFDYAISNLAKLAASALPAPEGRTRVLGVEELMYAPLRIALELPGEVTFSTTTRSPAVVRDDPGYPLRHGISFPAHEVGSTGPRFAYNIAPGGQNQIVLVLDDAYDTDDVAGLLDELVGLAPFVLVITVPAYRPPAPLRGPAFGSYPAADVSWLLTDLSAAELEAPTEERERAIQGGRHYSETLPIEYQPDPEYRELYSIALARSAERVALAVSSVGEQIRAHRGQQPVLVSLARAGTPVGVLLRRWAQSVNGLDWEPYSVSIVRDRGIDELALSYIAREHDPRNVMFVDGWTGKGAITRELTEAVNRTNERLGTHFDDTLAVLADPGHCVDLFGTRDDFLVPSACLNSTVSGLISRTVLNTDLLRRDQFHGAKFYRDLAPSDVTNPMIDAVSDHFANVQHQVPAILKATQSQVRDWRGWAAVESIAEEYGITNLNFVKPGVGETTRVLLRRMPWKILVRPDRVDDLAHIHHLATARGVDVVLRPDLAFSCVGLIRSAEGGDQ